MKVKQLNKLNRRFNRMQSQLEQSASQRGEAELMHKAVLNDQQTWRELLDAAHEESAKLKDIKDYYKKIYQLMVQKQL